MGWKRQENGRGDLGGNVRCRSREARLQVVVVVVVGRTSSGQVFWKMAPHGRSVWTWRDPEAPSRRVHCLRSAAWLAESLQQSKQQGKGRCDRDRDSSSSSSSRQARHGGAGPSGSADCGSYSKQDGFTNPSKRERREEETKVRSDEASKVQTWGRARVDSIVLFAVTTADGDGGYYNRRTCCVLLDKSLSFSRVRCQVCNQRTQV